MEVRMKADRTTYYFLTFLVALEEKPKIEPSYILQSNEVEPSVSLELIYYIRRSRSKHDRTEPLRRPPLETYRIPPLSIS